MANLSEELESQEYYEKLLNTALLGMNIGCSANPQGNGEQKAMEYIKGNIIEGKKDKVIVFDVGANVGDFSLLLSSIFNGFANIHAFEPSPKIYGELHNRSINGVNLHNIGFSDVIEEGVLYNNKDLPGLSSLYKRRLDHFGIYMEDCENINIDTIDHFCASQGIDSIFFLKLDVEGNELKVLKGASNIMDNGGIKYIQFEFGGCNIDSRTYFQDFWYALKDNYRIYRIVNNGLFEIKEYKEMYELFIMTNFLAEKV